MRLVALLGGIATMACGAWLLQRQGQIQLFVPVLFLMLGYSLMGEWRRDNH